MRLPRRDQAVMHSARTRRHCSLLPSLTYTEQELLSGRDAVPTHRLWCVWQTDSLGIVLVCVCEQGLGPPPGALFFSSSLSGRCGVQHCPLQTV